MTTQKHSRTSVPANSSTYRKILFAVVVVVIIGGGIGVVLFQQIFSKKPAQSANTQNDFSEVFNSATESGIINAPGVEDRGYITPLADAYRRLDPREDGWQSEAFNDAAGIQLKKLTKILEHPEGHENSQFEELVSPSFGCISLEPASLEEVFHDPSLRVLRVENMKNTPEETAQRGPENLNRVMQDFLTLFPGGIDRVKLKLFTVEPGQSEVTTKIYFQAFGKSEEGQQQVNATWRVHWNSDGTKLPRLSGIDILAYEKIIQSGSEDTMFTDCTESVLGEEAGYRRQLLYPTDHWRARFPRDLGLDVVANNGLAVGDVNGDGLDDLYICQQGGLPNRLFIQQSDGTLRDVTDKSGADWLDSCASALIVDLDNDGDRDLIVAQEWRILIMSNNGQGQFQIEFGTSSKAQTFSITAADYDTDGDVDVYVCGYNPSALAQRQGAMGEPIPYHDANNGGQNMLLRNEENWLFEDVTNQVGLDKNNTRFSFAASWEDYDNDGDVDLYVANDYGRNNLYRNDGNVFIDVAAELAVEDMSSGMSVSWADYNRDGWMDLYVANMFSAAGNRITYQRQFKKNIDPKVRAVFQRHARGNSLFENNGNGGFRDISEHAGVTMGRWAWGSKFVDLNSDGWEDLVVANGFISAEDSGDL